jgi:hypothetical protein
LESRPEEAVPDRVAIRGGAQGAAGHGEAGDVAGAEVAGAVSQHVAIKVSERTHRRRRHRRRGEHRGSGGGPGGHSSRQRNEASALELELIRLGTCFGIWQHSDQSKTFLPTPFM